MSNILNVIVCMLGILLALVLNNIINLLSLAYTILTAGCLIPFIGGLMWKKGNTKGALGSAICGVGCAVLIVAGVINPPYASIFPILPALIGYIVISLLTQSKETHSYETF